MEAWNFDHAAAYPCASCGYDLRGQVEPRCPECGLQFDPEQLPMPPIPWMRQGTGNTWGAYWATVGWVLLRPCEAARVVASAPVYLNLVASEFRRAILWQAVASALLSVALLAIGAIGQVGGGALAALVSILILFPGVFLFFWAVTIAHSTARLLWSRSILHDHAEALQLYATAPLALLPVLTVIAAVSMMADLGGNNAAAAQLRRLVLGGGAAIMFAWWGYTVLMMQWTGIWTTKEWLTISTLIPIRWCVVAVLVAAQTFFLSLCIFVPLRWLSD